MALSESRGGSEAHSDDGVSLRTPERFSRESVWKPFLFTRTLQTFSDVVPVCRSA